MAERSTLIDLFGPDGLAAMAKLARRRTLYAFDFDGTLAPIVDRPDDACASSRTVALLAKLGALVPTAIVTGRSVDDLRGRIAFEPSHVIGNHGAEGLPAGTSVGADDAHADVVRRWLAQWPASIAGHENEILVEPKTWSISLHYRHATDHEAARRAIGAAIERLDPAPRVIGGKCVFNLLPHGAPDKGSALRALVRHERCDAAFFIGDDLTDEAAFVDAPDSWVTVRVGPADDSAARYMIDGQAEIDRCLEHLIAAIERA